MNKFIVHYLQAISDLQKIVFSIYINRDYFDNLMEYEKKLMSQSKVVMKAMQRIRFQNQAEKIVSQLENLYEIIFALDLLKNRLIDHSTFEICEIELKNVSLSISEVLANLIKDREIPSRNVLDTAIESLEFLFQNTLQVVTNDPMVFVFFIRNLHALNDELTQIQGSLKECA